MFTGIIQRVGVIRSVQAVGAGRRLVIDISDLAAGLKLGDSVATNGVCLTVSQISPPTAAFDAVTQTLGRTNLIDLTAGSKVNLELPLLLGGRLDGHLVQGHVDGVAHLQQPGHAPDWLWRFGCPENLTSQMVPKGSVALDGVSLTVVGVQPTSFTVALIPTTLAGTTLGQLAVGAKVNVETDILGKYVQRYLGNLAAGGGLTMDKLRRAGFAE